MESDPQAGFRTADGGADRGVSPAVGTAALILIVILLVAVSGTVIMSIPERTDPSPDVVLELQAGDRFPTHYLRHEGGDRLGGTGRTEIRGIATPDILHSDELIAGERRAVVPTDEEIQLVWFGDDGTSYVLWRASPSSHLDVSPDEGCGWVANRTNNGSDPITVDGLTVNCDIITEGDIDLVNGGIIVGNTTSTRDNVDLDESAVYGPVGAAGDVDLDGTDVSGSVTSGGSDVVVTDGSDVDGDVTIGSGGNVDIDGGSSVAGTVTAGNAIHLDSVTIEGDVVSDSGDVYVSGSTVGGDVRTDGTVDLNGTTVAGDVYVDSDSFSCSDSEINGQDCGSYTPKDPDG